MVRAHELDHLGAQDRVVATRAVDVGRLILGGKIEHRVEHSIDASEAVTRRRAHLSSRSLGLLLGRCGFTTSTNMPPRTALGNRSGCPDPGDFTQYQSGREVTGHSTIATAAPPPPFSKESDSVSGYSAVFEYNRVFARYHRGRDAVRRLRRACYRSAGPHVRDRRRDVPVDVQGRSR